MSDPSDNPLRKLIGEVHRRSLWQVLGIYLLGSTPEGNVRLSAKGDARRIPHRRWL